jgi:hypothetical protein
VLLSLKDQKLSTSCYLELWNYSSSTSALYRERLLRKLFKDKKKRRITSGSEQKRSIKSQKSFNFVRDRTRTTRTKFERQHELRSLCTKENFFLDFLLLSERGKDLSFL